MKRNRVVIAGYYGFGNAGDELILRSMIDAVYAEGSHFEVVVLSNRPDETRRQYGVEAVDRWKPWQWPGLLLSARRFILGGGGLLQESTGHWNHAYYLILVVLAKCFGAKTEIRAIGVDPIQTTANRLLTRAVFNHFVDYASVRDVDSQRALESAGVWIPILRTCDPIFQLSAPESKPSHSRIAFAVAPWNRRPGWEHDLAMLFKKIHAELNVGIDVFAFYPAEDEWLAQRSAELSGDPVRYRPWTNPEDLVTWMGEYSLVVGMRYHALALAALSERAFVGWGYQRKVRSLCREFGQPLWTFERGWESDAVFRQISQAWRQRDILPHRYRQQLPDFRSSPPTHKDLPRIFPSRV